MTRSRATAKQRGAETQTAVAGWFAAHGWPFAESTGAGRSGVDITGVPGLAVEVKGRSGFRPMEWLRQACGERRNGVPFVVWRPDGYGPARIGEWPVMLTLADLTDLLRAAGYGDPTPERNTDD